MATTLDPAERILRGIAIGRQATGAAAAEPATPVEASWRDFVFAEVWNRPGLDRRARFLIAIAGAASAAAPAATIEAYVRGALTTGDLSLAELREGALHFAVYGGWSRGDAIDAAITKVAGELGIEAPALHPIRAAPWDPEVRTAEGQAGFTHVMTFPGGPSVTPFMEAINNFVFGEMWCREGLDQRSRRFLTLIGVCDSAAEVPILSHIHAAMASGNCTPAEMHEFVLAYGIHAGWPRASRIQGAVWDMIRKFEAGLGWNG